MNVDNLKVDAGRPASHRLLYEGHASRVDNPVDIAWGYAEDYTLAPKTHEVNGYEVLAPLGAAPVVHTEYFTADPACKSMYGRDEWLADSYALEMLKRGNCFATKGAPHQVKGKKNAEYELL